MSSDTSDVPALRSEVQQGIHLLQSVVNCTRDALFVKDVAGNYVFCNVAAARIVERPVEKILGRNDFDLFGPELAHELRRQDLRILETRETETEERIIHVSGVPRNFSVTKSPFCNIDGTVVGVVGVSRDITLEKAATTELLRQQAILEQIAQGTPLEDVLNELVTMIELELPGVIGSFLLLDRNGKRLQVTAGRNLPQSYNDAIDGVEIGPNVGSCGTAAYLGRSVLVSDIATDPLWENYRDLALAHGLRACWSTPIRSRKNTDKAVLGTFAVYSRQSGPADPRLNMLINRIEYLACIAIENSQAIENLKVSEARFRTFVENTADAFFLHRHDGEILDVNHQACLHLGYDRDELIGLKPSEFNRRIMPDLTALDRGEPLTFETEHLRKNGTAVPVEVRLSPFRMNQEKLAIATVQDISARRKAEDEIRRQQKMLEDAQALAHLGSFEWDLATNQIFWSNELYRIYGYSPQEVELTLDRFLGHIHPDDRERVQIIIQNACLQGSSFRMEERIQRKDGSIRTLESQGEVILDRSGKPARILGVCLDITERKLAEERLSETNRQLASIYETAGDVLFLLRVESNRNDYRFQSINPAFTRSTGLPMDAVIGKCVGEVIPEPSLSFILDQYRCAIEEKRVVRWEETTVYPSGTLVGEVCVAPVFDDHGICTHLVGSVHEITARKRTENALRESEERLRVALQAAGAVAFVWDAKSDSITRYYCDEPTLTAKVDGPHPIARVRDQVHPDDLKQFDAGVAACLTHSTEYQNTYRVVRADSTVRWLEEWGIMERDSDGVPQRLVGVAIDITNRKRTETDQQKLATIIQHSSDFIGIADMEGRVTFLNSGGRRMIGLDEDSDCTQLQFTDYVPEEWQEFFRDTIIPQVLETGLWEGEMQLRNLKTGELIEVFRSTFLIHDPVDGSKCFASVTRDITRSKRAELELRRTADLLSAVADGTVDAVFVKDRDGKYLFFNKAASQFVGKPISEVLGKDDTNLFDPESAKFVMNRDRQVMATGDVATAEETISISGVTRTFLATKGPYRDDAGNIVGTIGISHDITDRKKAEEAVQASEREFADFFENATVGIHLVGPDGTIFRANRAELNMLGYTRDEYVGRNIAEFHESRGAIEDILCRLRNREDLVSHPARLICKNGAIRDVVIDSSVRWDGDQLINTRCFTRDVTDNKRMEEQIRQSQKMDAVGTLAGGVAHDFNNLLTVINGYAEVLLTDFPENATIQEPLTAILNAGKRAAGLTAQLLAFSRKTIIEPKVLDLNHVIESITRMLSRLIREDIILSVKPGEALRRIKADPGQIEQVIINLVVNARDAMPNGGRLTIETGNVTLGNKDLLCYPDLSPGEYVRIRVADTGEGMTEEVRSKIFEPFFTTKEVGKGTGLGLAVAHGVVKQCGGHISLESTLGSGTVFTILLPSVHEEAAIKRSTNNRQSYGGTETVLLVEDDVSVRKIARIALTTMGFNVLEANGGPSALKLIAEYTEPIHLLVTDIVMPEMGGRQLAETVRIRVPGIRIIYMSGHTEDVIIHDGLFDANDSFLQKPFTPLGLARKVRTMLDGIP